MRRSSATRVTQVTRAALLAVVALTPVAGCWETPSREWYAARDGGLDACVGAACCDGGCCGDAACDPPDADVGVVDRPRERLCDDGLDNDDDGVRDCADFDCADHASCCADGALLFQEDWSGADLTFLWSHLPTAAPTSSPARDPETGMLSGWPGTAPHTLLWNRCVPLALGAELAFEAIAVARDAICADWPEPCDQHAAVVLSSARDTQAGQPLLDDLAIRVHGDSRVLAGGSDVIFNQAMVRVTQGGQELGRVLIDPAVRYRVALRVTPSTHAGAASLRGDVEVRRVDAAADDPGQTIGGFFISTQAALERQASGCLEVGGLYAAIEMVGDAGALLGPLRAETLACANPSQFQEAPNGTATLTSDTLGVPSSYGGAYIGAPSLGSSFNSALDPSPRWDLFFEGSNEPPELERDGPVGYAIAHARTATFGALPADWTTSAVPRLGNDSPSCLVSGGSCPGPSVREPFLLVRRGTDDVLQDFTLAFASPVAAGAHALLIEEDVSFSPSAPLGGPGGVVLTPDAACVDLRDPALLPVTGGSGGYWLFFTCARPGAPSELRAARLNNDFGLRAGSVRAVLTPASVGAIAGGGLSGPEPMVRHTATGATLQLWFVARDASGNTTLALATGQVPAAPTPDGGVPEPASLDALPALEAYVANPVLRSEDPVLGGCPGLCRITGAAVSDTAGNHDELRFMVARRVVHPGGAVTRELVPLTQAWRVP
jgi:hypothetical protein